MLHLKKSNFDRRLDFVGNLLLVAKSKFGLSDLIREIQMTPPDSSLTYRKHEKRVLINPVAVNPVSTGISKGWPANKFIRLARKIKRKGYTPIFCVPPSEHASLEDVARGRISSSDV